MFAHPVTDEYVRLYVNRLDLGRFHNIKSVLAASRADEKAASDTCMMTSHASPATVIEIDAVATKESEVDSQADRQAGLDTDWRAPATAAEKTEDPIESFTQN